MSSSDTEVIKDEQKKGEKSVSKIPAPVTQSWSEALYNVFFSSPPTLSPVLPETTPSNTDIFIVTRDEQPLGWFSSYDESKKYQTEVVKEIISEINEAYDLAKVTITTSGNTVKMYVKDVTVFAFFSTIYTTISIVRVSKGVEIPTTGEKDVHSD